MEEIGEEPWNNGYVLANETERLLIILKEGPLSEDDVVLLFVDVEHLIAQLDDRSVHEMERNVLQGLTDFLLSFGRSGTFGDSIRGLESQADEIRKHLDWSRLPKNEQKSASRRARFLLDYGQRQGWLERRPETSEYAITKSGLAALDSGFFNIR